jgi:hypothetical protein
MEIQKTLYLCSIGLAFLTTIISFMPLTPASILWQSMLVILLLLLVLLGAVIGWRKLPQMTWLMFGLLSMMLALNALYILTRVGIHGLPLFIATSLLCLAAFLISLFGFLTDKPRISLPHIQRTKEIVVEGIQPKKMTYVAAINGKKYHSPSCRLAKSIKEDKLVWFVNKGEAEDKKYEPCELCID